MPNLYYNAPADNVPLTTVRSANENTDRRAVEAAFDKIPAQADLERSLYGVDNSTLSTLYEITVPYIVGSYTEGTEITFEALLTNTGAANIQLNGLQIVSLLDSSGNALAAGIIQSGQMIKCVYTSAGNFRILNVVNVGTVSIDQSADYNWSGTHDWTGATINGIGTDLTADYDWTGQHTFTSLPTVNGNEVYTSANIADAVVGVTTTLNASYTAALSDRNTLVVMNNSTAGTFTIPLESAVNFAIGTTISVMQYTTNEVEIAATAGVTLVGEAGAFITNAQYAFATIVKIAADTWIVSGSLRAA